MKTTCTLVLYMGQIQVKCVNVSDATENRQMLSFTRKDAEEFPETNKSPPHKRFRFFLL